MTDENASETPSDLSIEVYTSPARPFTSPPRVSPLTPAKEGVDITGELGVLLEQEPVGGVWVDLDAGLRNQAG
jgi:hypothetical protein